MVACRAQTRWLDDAACHWDFRVGKCSPAALNNPFTMGRWTDVIGSSYLCQTNIFDIFVREYICIYTYICM